MHAPERPLFREEQRFRQPWLWALVVLIAAFSWYSFVVQIVLQRPVGQRPASDVIVAVVWLLFGLGLVALMWGAKLLTEVRSDGLYVRLVPFHWRWHVVPYDQIVRFQACTYRPIRDYGGWGIRYGSKGKAYNVSGNRGVELELAGGRHLLIGSQQPEAVVRAMEQAMGKW
ncbi:MAG: DUF6141 family protein [candidate division KSB1 bacterium]|nr:DUF6141 family protein [candidate division KSB1 bacterium]